jgi:GNAT superfamily N-acetyltransferase
MTVKYLGRRPGAINPGKYTGITERLISGELMPERLGCTWPESQRTWLSGTQGFLDFQNLYDRKMKERTLLLLLIGVEPDYMRTGVATALVRAAEQLASERGLLTVQTTEARSDNDAEVGLFENCGYAATCPCISPGGNWKEYTAGGHIAKLLFSKKL